MPKPTFDDFSRLFPYPGGIAKVEPISGDLVPPPYGELLVHRFHMTVTVESYFQDRVNVSVMESRRSETEYARAIFLTLSQTGRVVQFGTVRIELSMLSTEVSQAILSERTPLGRVLINHGVLTTIEPVTYLKVAIGTKMAERFGCAFPATTYGRIGEISANGHPAIQVLEILTPGLDNHK